jgi:hypothetical protein
MSRCWSERRWLPLAQRLTDHLAGASVLPALDGTTMPAISGVRGMLSFSTFAVIGCLLRNGSNIYYPREAAGREKMLAQISRMNVLAEGYRALLHDLPWFMRSLNDQVARLANGEDGVTCTLPVLAANGKGVAMLFSIRHTAERTVYTLTSDGRGRNLGDFSQQSYQLTCLFARLLCCAKGYIAGLCAPLRALQADENPAQSGSFVSSIRLSCSNSSWIN